MSVDFKKYILTGWTQKPWYIGALVVGLLVNFPPVHTVDLVHNSIQFKNTPNSLQAGSAIVIPKQREHVVLNTKRLSDIEGKKLSFGVVSVYSHSPAVLGFIPRQYKNWRESLKRYFRGPKLVWSYQTITVEKKTLKHSSNLRLPSSVIKKLSSVDRDKKRAERRKLRRILRTYNGNISSNCFQKPVNSKLISKYASPRKLPSGRKYYHTGIDLRAWYGTPIRAASAGKVALQEHFTAPGNNVVLDHGGGLFSRYMHFSKFGKQKLGQRIPASTIIGYSGSTGRSQAPHLHFEIIWKGNHASPLRFLRTWEQICDPA